MKTVITATRKGKVVYEGCYSYNKDVTELVNEYEKAGYEVVVEVRDRPSFHNFDEYVKVFPNGEKWRHWVCHKQYALIPVKYSCLDGNYAYVHVDEFKNEMFVHVDDGDDFMFRKKVQNEQEALKEIENLKLLSPFLFTELLLFGYEG